MSDPLPPPLTLTSGEIEQDEFARYRAEVEYKHRAARKGIWGALTFVFILGLLLVFIFHSRVDGWSWSGALPKDPEKAALVILDNSPVIDGHIDLPELVRYVYANNVSAVNLEEHTPGDVDIPRLRQGKVGGFFWSVYVDCPSSEASGPDFNKASWRVRDTLEQIDVARLLIDKYPDTFELTLDSQAIIDAISRGKIASLLGVEGAHQLGNSIALLRQYYALGVRYVTLTHSCNNAFADSAGVSVVPAPIHHGLSPLGRSLIAEMNRIGMLVDISHTSDDTARQAIELSKAPLIWSHSSAREVNDHVRNVPDSVLELIGTEEGKKDGVVMVNFYPAFVSSTGRADVNVIANHVEHIAKVSGKKHVGIGSDFDGIGSVPEGLEDVSKYPALIAELYRRGWNKYELAGLTGGNLLRVLAGAEKVAYELQKAGTPPVTDLYEKRPDLPIRRGEL